MSWNGARRAKVLQTPEDVLVHSYGHEPPPAALPEASGSVPGKSDLVPPPPPSETDPPPASTADPSVGDGQPIPSDEGETVESVASQLEAENKKDELVKMAEEAGLDSSGNKMDIARRIAEHLLA